MSEHQADQTALYKIVFRGTEHFQYTDLDVRYPIVSLDDAEYWADELRANADGEEEIVEVVEIASGTAIYLACVVTNDDGEGVPQTWRAARCQSRAEAESFCDDNRAEDESECALCGAAQE